MCAAINLDVEVSLESEPVENLKEDKVVKKYTFDEVYNASLEYFNGNELAADVFVNKYALKDNDSNYYELTPADMHDRLAREFARIDSENYKLNFGERYNLYRNSIDRFARICLQGSPMSAVGNPYQLMSASNCVVVQSPEDSIEGIFKSGEELAQLYKRRCGVGIDISTLRPDGSSVNNAARTTTGAWSFADFYSYVTRMIGQNSRRGALMVTLDVHHPDILEFATMKQDLTKVTGANVSLKLSDEFLTAVEKNTDYEVRWPCDSKTPKVKSTLKARDVWNVIIESATKTAEPGLLLWDNIVDNLPANCYEKFKTISTNPCQPGWATILTSNGISTISQVQIGDVIWTGKRWAKISNKAETGIKDVFAYRTRAGTFYGTDTHRVVSQGNKIEAKFADSIDLALGEINIDDVTKLETPELLRAIMDGLVIGDGTMHKASNNLVLLCIGTNDHDYFKDPIAALIKQKRDGVGEYVWEVDTSITNLPRTFARKVPETFKYGAINEKRAFLRGIYSANGSVVNNRVTLKTASFQIIEDVQQMLSSLGIVSYYTINKPKTVKFTNGEYGCKTSYDLNIGTLDGRKKFNYLIGFIQKYKNDKLSETLNTNISIKPFKNTYDIVDVEYVSTECVFDITVDAPEHTYWTGGLLVSNCSEIPLSAYDSCRLISINLTGYVKNAFEKNTKFDFELFKNDIKTATYMADNLVDIELELINKIINACSTDREKSLWRKLFMAGAEGRRTGIGTHGLADTLAQLCIKYDSKEAIEIVLKIYETLRNTSYETSVELSEIRGPFKLYDFDKEQSCEFIKRLPKSILNKMKKYGRRNISLLTQAPTGSVSLLSKVGEFDAYNVSSGVEPVFRNSYIRRKKINPNDAASRTDYVDALGDKWQEFTVYHSNVQNYLTKFKKNELPKYFITSDQIDWQKRIEIQAAEQLNVDHAISSTINLPKETKPETVGQIYLEAWKKGLKGVTVYVDGCRDGVLISSEETKSVEGRPQQIINSEAPCRPKELPCEIHHVKVKGQKWTVLVGLLNDRPYEMFLGHSENIDLPSKLIKGKIIKNGKGAYNLHVAILDEEMIIRDVIKTFDNPESASVTRMVSMSLRHGVPVEFVCEQLSKDGLITDINKVIARILKKYIPNGESKVKQKCGQCEAETVIYQEGCLSCTSCGYSKCS